MTTSLPPTLPAASFWRRAGNLAQRAVKVELRIYVSLWRAIARKPLIPIGGRGFTYHRPVLTVLIIFMVLSAVEIPILDAIVHRWLPVRIFFLAIGIWGLTWMIGLLCAFLTRPHTVSAEGIRVREGLELDIFVPWDEFASIRRFDTAVDPNDPDRIKGRVFVEGDETVCAVRISHETNLEISFERPTKIQLPGLHPKGGTHEITVLRFWADDPAAFLETVRASLSAR
ncbi:hypothetical protein [Leucobacter denitrificans]|uniref:PH domain-containing protein n=1 Tax=Leucobacter denitrificans TaxID=683042 RepID=A0A7G9S3Q7_9MICO|nr:hypothetical protein [Leucobacter denitrificans]QNN62482.1 hypothetical protein H9L06_09535 [Leucobacter denitrificans]